MSLTELVGRSVSFRYPKHNFRIDGIPRCTEVRRCKIEGVRDCEAFPIEADTVTMNPHLNRGRWLVEAYDYDREGLRCFYWESMQDVQIERGGFDDPAAEHPQAVFVVPRDDDWTPAGPLDVPPGVDRYEQPSGELAREFAEAFNTAELTAPKGIWAVH